MAIDRDLVLFGLGIQNNQPPATPPNSIQPKLVDGIHLRWAFRPELGFPWYGFYLFRRVHRPGQQRCIGEVLQKPSGAPTSLNLGSNYGTLTCAQGLVFPEGFAPSATPEVALSNQVEFAFARPVRSMRITIGFTGSASITATALFNGVPVAQNRATGTAGSIATITIGADKINLVRFSSGAASLIELCFVDVNDDFDGGWEPVPGFPYPLPLPVGDPGYPCNPGPGGYGGSSTDGGGRVSTGDPGCVTAEIDSTGTISVINGSPIVTGVGTSWTQDLVGTVLRIQGDLGAYTIAAVLGPGKLVLNRPYQGASGSGLIYRAMLDPFGELYDHLKALVAGGPAAGPMANRFLPSLVANAGSVSVTQGSPLVNGSGTSWDSQLVGLKLQVARATTGSVRVIHGSDIVDGSGTNWGEEMVGMLFQAADDPALLVIEEVYGATKLRLSRPYMMPAQHEHPYTIYDSALYEVVAVHSATQLELNVPYAEPSISGKAYNIFARYEQAEDREAVLFPQYPIDTVLLAALDPKYAQMLGLYWVDRQVSPGVAYDYLIIGDYGGEAQLSRSKMLGLIPSLSFKFRFEYDIIFNQRMGSATTLAPPTNLTAYALPGGDFAADNFAFTSGSVGLRWDLGRSSTGELLPDRAVMYHLWRAPASSNPATTPTTPPADTSYILQTEIREPFGATTLHTYTPILVPLDADPDEQPPRPADWPSISFHTIDNGLAEGWYSYRVCGVDLFGRHSEWSAPSRWANWQNDTPAKSFAVQLLDKLPPPAPAGVEAWVLDPKDPTVLKDAAYNAWRGLPGMSNVLGLRVRWRWTPAQQAQATDLREFRIYYHPGAYPPAAYSYPENWERRVGLMRADTWIEVEPDGSRIYEIFLPGPQNTIGEIVTLTTSSAQPIDYAHVSVSASDNNPHTSDKRPSGGYTGRVGNEGPAGTPVKVFRVHRQRPAPPKAPPPDSAKVFATPADYYGRSFYTYKWVPEQDLRTHIYRALDDAVFNVDWPLRPRAALSAGDTALFPESWSADKRTAVAAELNQLNSMGSKAAALEYYRGLSNDALLVLAGLPGVERAFIQLTKQPLDPGAAPFGIANLREYEDTLDGRSRNRYFYRAGYVDKAHNLSEGLSHSSPPIWLPDVAPARTPIIAKVLGGDRKITISWLKNPEADLKEYRIYRAESAEDARDIRSMALVHSEPASSGQTSWEDAGVASLSTFFYRLVALREATGAASATELLSPPSPIAQARPYDYTPPAPPSWGPAVRNADGSITLSWATPTPLRALVERQQDDSGWRGVSGWLAAGTTSFADKSAEDQVGYHYRLRVQNSVGTLSVAYMELEVLP